MAEESDWAGGYQRGYEVGRASRLSEDPTPAMPLSDWGAESRAGRAKRTAEEALRRFREQSPEEKA